MELDKTKVYYLGDLTEDELYKIAEMTDYTNNFKEFKKDSKKYFLYFVGEWVLDYSSILSKNSTANAKELFYTLENVQIDCRKLTEKQIENLKTVVIKNGYSLCEDSDAFDIFSCFNYFSMSNGEKQYFFIRHEDRNKTTISYEKFMELFDKEKDEDISSLNIAENGWEEYKKQSAEEHKIEEIIKFLTEKGIFLSPEQYKKLWEN